MAEENEDEELEAIKTVLGALTPLKPEARSNVIDYVFRRLGIAAPAVATRVPPATPGPASPVPDAAHFHAPPQGPRDLRSLTDQKQPKSVNQMVAILAYYLAHLAPANERRDYVVADDIKKYFPQANFELPTGSHHGTLVNAKNAGYLDGLERGQCSATESAVPEDAANTIDALIADMTRSTYDRGSLSAHQERGKKKRRAVEAVCRRDPP
jgi:hypothetical protein